MAKKPKSQKDRAKALRQQKNLAAKALQKSQNLGAKNYLRKKGMPEILWDYKLAMMSVVPSAFNKDGRMSAMTAENHGFSREPKYFGLSCFDPEFENPFFGRDDELEKLVCQAYGVDPKYDYTLLENRPDAIMLVVSRDVGETDFHAILFAHGNLEIAKNENIHQGMIDYLS